MLDKQDRFCDGLCSWAADLDLPHEEFVVLYEYIQTNRPSRLSSWEAFKHSLDAYWWKSYDIKPRIKWIEKHIKKNS